MAHYFSGCESGEGRLRAQGFSVERGANLRESAFFSLPGREGSFQSRPDRDVRPVAFGYLLEQGYRVQADAPRIVPACAFWVVRTLRACRFGNGNALHNRGDSLLQPHTPFRE